LAGSQCPSGRYEEDKNISLAGMGTPDYPDLCLVTTLTELSRQNSDIMAKLRSDYVPEVFAYLSVHNVFIFPNSSVKRAKLYILLLRCMGVELGMLELPAVAENNPENHDVTSQKTIILTTAAVRT
jgi:hypothetical protein